MKTRGLINSLCFVEIKKHDTKVLAQSSHRPGTWSPSRDLADAVSQVQVTVQEAIENIGRKLAPTDSEGNPTDEPIFNIEPRSFLVVGSLGEFNTPNGVNELRFRAFELYRRNTRNPEILTFDELLNRAKFIVEQTD